MNRPRQIYTLWLFPLLIAWTINLGAQCDLSCHSSLEVSLNTSGYRVMTPSLLLDSSTTCQSPYYIDIDGPLLDTVFCDQVDQYLNVLVQHVTSGQKCYVQIHVVDHIVPSITCPQDVTIRCDEDYNDLDLTGEPLIYENCQPDTFYLDNLDSLSSCQTGFVDRLWTVEDPSGNEDNCSQRIYLVDTIPPSISWPEDITLSCQDNENDLDVTGRPVVVDECSNDIGMVSTDAVYPLCGGSRNIIRKWEVIDWCNYDPITGEGVSSHRQVIRMEDDQSPVITCPDNLTIGNDPGKCLATLFLPDAEASDSCSSVTIQPYLYIDDVWVPVNGDELQSLPIGVQKVRYIAEDACGLRDTCSSEVLVLDDEDPVARNPTSKTFSITSGDQVFIDAEDLDSGSSDNCEIDTMLISRDSTTFHNQLGFSCNDVLSSPIPIYFKVVDKAGNTATNTVLVIIKDKRYPNISCPVDVSVFCEEDPFDLNLTGEAFATDNCDYEITYNDQDNRNYCGLGLIVRTWKVEDISGNITTCQQEVLVKDTTSPLIHIPADTMVICGSNTSPDSMGFAEVEDDCGSFGFSYTDDVFYIHPPESYRIFRTWRIVNFCDSNYEEEFVQEIEVLDTIAPVLKCPGDTILASGSQSCEKWIDLEVTFTDNCSNDVDISHNSLYADQSGADASGSYPVGSHSITFTASDASGNEGQCSVTVEVKDSTEPTAVCQLGLIVNLPAGGVMDITPDFVDAGSFDNCSDSTDLVREVSPSRFSCETLGDVEVSLIITDEAGNQSTCTSVITVQDNMDHCPDLIDIGGLLITEYGDVISGAEVSLIGDGGDTLTTDDNGEYMFIEQPVGSNYVVRPSLTANPSNGISTFDFLLIRRHILNKQVFDSPYKMIAADANKSNSISTFDIVVLRRLLLNHIDSFPNNDAWRFVDASYNFPAAFDPFTDPFPEEMFLEGVMANKLNADFIGIKIGDVNGTASTNNVSGNGHVRSAHPELEASIITSQRNDQVVAELYMPTEKTLGGFQFSLQVDTTRLRLEDVEWASYFGFTKENISVDTERHTIQVSWDGLPGVQFTKMEPLLRIKLTCRTPYQLEQPIFVKYHSRLQPEAYTPEAKIYSLNMVETLLKPKSRVQVFPNPFKEQVMITFEMERKELISLQLFNSQGQSCLRRSLTLDPGKQAIQITGKDLEHPGLYFYEISTESARYTGKIQYVTH